MVIDCSECDLPVVAKPRGFMTRYDPSEGPPERWTLLECPSHHPLLVLQEMWNGEEFDDEFRVIPDTRFEELEDEYDGPENAQATVDRRQDTYARTADPSRTRVAPKTTQIEAALANDSGAKTQRPA